MQKRFALLAASTAVAAAVGLPSLASMRTPASESEIQVFPWVGNLAAKVLPVVRVSGDDDDDDDDDDEDDDDCEDDARCRSGQHNPAPAGTVAPPQNGLFGDGAAPQVQVN